MRFGFEIVEYIAKLNGCKAEILDSPENSEQEELVEELTEGSEMIE